MKGGLQVRPSLSANALGLALSMRFLGMAQVIISKINSINAQLERDPPLETILTRPLTDLNITEEQVTREAQPYLQFLSQKGWEPIDFTLEGAHKNAFARARDATVPPSWPWCCFILNLFSTGVPDTYNG